MNDMTLTSSLRRLSNHHQRFWNLLTKIEHRTNTSGERTSDFQKEFTAAFWIRGDVY